MPWWIAASTGGAVLGAFLLPQLQHLPVFGGTTTAVLALAAGGGGQFLAVRGRIESVWTWLAATAGGWVLGLASTFTVFFLTLFAVPAIGLNAILGGAAGGFVLGSIQWVALSSRLQNRFHWVFSNVLGGIAVVLVVLAHFDTGGSTIVFAGVAGAIYGLASGYGISNLQPIPESLRRPRSYRTAPRTPAKQVPPRTGSLDA